MELHDATYLSDRSYRPWRKSRRVGYLAWGALVGAAWASATVLITLVAASGIGSVETWLVQTGMPLTVLPVASWLDVSTATAATILASSLIWLVVSLVLALAIAMARPTATAASRMVGLGGGVALGAALLPVAALVSIATA